MRTPIVLGAAEASAARESEMIVPYADAAASMLARRARGGPMLRKRVRIALPVGMRGSKDQ
jgi:hypothetical protein